MSKVSKVGFAAFLQHCIQINGTHVRGVLYSVYRPLVPQRLPEKTSLMGLAVHQSKEAALF